MREDRITDNIGRVGILLEKYRRKGRMAHPPLPMLRECDEMTDDMSNQFSEMEVQVKDVLSREIRLRHGQ